MFFFPKTIEIAAKMHPTYDRHPDNSLLSAVGYDEIDGNQNPFTKLPAPGIGKPLHSSEKVPFENSVTIPDVNQDKLDDSKEENKISSNGDPESNKDNEIDGNEPSNEVIESNEIPNNSEESNSAASNAGIELSSEMDSHASQDTNCDSSEFISEPETDPYFSNVINKPGTKPYDENLDYDDYDYNENTLQCVECDSRIDGSRCFHVGDVKYFSMCHSKIGQCYTALINGDVVRGCVGDDVFPNIEKTGLPDDAIQLCNNDRLCNQDDIEDTCIISSDMNPNYEIIELHKEKACSFSEPSGCYLKKTGFLSERGCLIDLADEERFGCQERGSRICQSCHTQNCNKKIDFDLKCFYCNGTTDENCHKTNVSHIEITCIDYSSVCIVGIDVKGYTHRQCSLNEYKDAERFAQGYELCYENHCNSNIYPENRQKCFKCNGDSFCDHASADYLPELCLRFPDECFTFEYKEGKFHFVLNDILLKFFISFFFSLENYVGNGMYRGCMSDKDSEAQMKCQKEEKKCHKCNTTECNYQQTFQLNHPIKKYRPSEYKSNFGDYDINSGHHTSFYILITFMGAVFTQLI